MNIDFNLIFASNKKFIIHFFIFFIITSHIIYLKKLSKIQTLKICLCTIGKNENDYSIEFINHYKNYSIDKIYIYDNNDIEGERFESILNNYIKSKFVEIINYRGQNRIQLKSMNDCYQKNYLKYDWLLFYDMDEFIHLKEPNIKHFLISQKFNSCDKIFLNWVNHLDNDQLKYKNESLFKRFPKSKYFFNEKKAFVKSMIRGHIENYIISDVHVLDFKKKNCNIFGKKIQFTDIFTDKPDNTSYYIDHFYFKSTEEYIKKRNKGDVYYGNSSRINPYYIDLYFKYNKITIEKINYFENMTGINLSKYKNV
jgi:hypothetical protein